MCILCDFRIRNGVLLETALQTGVRRLILLVFYTLDVANSWANF